MKPFDEMNPPVFKLRNNDENAIEGNYEWDNDTIDCDTALNVVADYLGPQITAQILARHWIHSGRGHDLRELINCLSELQRRLKLGS